MRVKVETWVDSLGLAHVKANIIFEANEYKPGKYLVEAGSGWACFELDDTAVRPSIYEANVIMKFPGRDEKDLENLELRVKDERGRVLRVKKLGSSSLCGNCARKEVCTLRADMAAAEEVMEEYPEFTVGCNKFMSPLYTTQLLSTSPGVIDCCDCSENVK